jgi:two-component system NtrC family response regulator
MSKPKLLVVDDDSGILTQMKWALAKEYQVFLAGDRKQALEIVKNERPPVVTLDLGLPPSPDDVVEGFVALSEMLEASPLTKIIIITGRDEKENALKAVSEGGYDFFCKPIVMEELKVVLHRAFHLHSLEAKQAELQRCFVDEQFEGMIGVSEKMQEVFTEIRKVAPSDAPVLILGESGTGKEVAAQAIHRQSNRKEQPFIAINCGAIPENLLESELFGHEKGSFTGAHAQRKGKIESADKGTLFLDEIGDLPMSLQVKLLRFLEQKQIERIGGRALIEVDARIISATNVDIHKAMSQNAFREDLYYRLGVVTINLPPLRKRQDDLLLLANAFLHQYALENKKKIAGFSKTAIQAIQSHGWSGNVRELKNRIKRAVIMAEGKKIAPSDLELVTPYNKYDGLTLKEAREALERDFIQSALIRNKGNITKVAKELDISRPALYEIMDKLKIEKESTRDKG